MKIRKSAKDAAQLDEAVHKKLHRGATSHFFPAYTIDWCHGGPIIEKNRISVWAKPKTKHTWAASIDYENVFVGSSPLIAAMKCFVGSDDEE